MIEIDSHLRLPVVVLSNTKSLRVILDVKNVSSLLVDAA